ncbi:MAG TPA: Tat pathway signal protein, partial [Flavihumibacter sp.]|nr:Tat pathway signal protein [Flavihumibacter sp.]
MHNRRKFIRNGLITAVAAPLVPAAITATETPAHKEMPAGKGRHWVWINPDNKDEPAALEKRYREFAAAGIRGVLFEADSEKHFRAAKKAGLEAHRWNWTMNRGDAMLMEN